MNDRSGHGKPCENHQEPDTSEPRVHRCLGLRFATHLAMCHARLEVKMESLSPFLWGSCIPYNMPVYPGAFRVARNSPRISLPHPAACL